MATMFGVRKDVLWIWDFTKKWCEMWDLTAPGKWNSPKLGMGCGTAT